VTARGEGPADARGPAHDEDQHGAGFLTIGNILSLLRIPLGFTFLFLDRAEWLGAVVLAGAATDLLDGFLSRVTRTETEIGALLDPFCDRIFVFLGLVSFLPTERIDWAGFVILILRDIFTGGVFLVGHLAGREMPFHSRFGGKITTSFQVLALLTLVFWPTYVKIPVFLAGISAVYAIIDYGTAGIKRWGPPVEATSGGSRADV
jgi:phosphatidylglycerophosphate synthase